MVRDTVIVAAGVVERKGKILCARRKKGTHLEGHWEFPGGKLEPGESPEECLVRELEEEIGVSVGPGSILDVVFHRYPEKSVLLLFYGCTLDDDDPEPRPIDCAELLWVERERLPALDWAPADVAFVRKLAGVTRAGDANDSTG